MIHNNKIVYMVKQGKKIKLGSPLKLGTLHSLEAAYCYGHHGSLLFHDWKNDWTTNGTSIGERMSEIEMSRTSYESNFSFTKFPVSSLVLQHVAYNLTTI